MAFTTIADIESTAKEKMAKSIHVLKEELSAIRAGRANPQVLDRITVEYYGVPTPINQVANISVPEPRMLMISVWDASLIKEVEKAIQKSDLGINPSNDGKVIRLIFPELNEERRRDLTKQIRKYGEDAKIVIRNIRRDANDASKKLKKDNLVTEDEEKKCEDNIQKLTDNQIKEIDNILNAKEKEIMDL
jgi:ribosome recycling factor